MPDHTQPLLPEGKYRDQLFNADGSCSDYGWRGNIIVDQCRQLLAGFMKGDSANGVQYIALGRGDVSWDEAMPVPPQMSTESLIDPAPETIAITDAEMSIDFVDSSGVVTVTPSNRIQVSITVAGSNLPIVGDETFPLREFGLFGLLVPDDYMIDYVRHPVIHIGSADTLVRRVKLVF
jgi:hypothetical protein